MSSSDSSFSSSFFSSFFSSAAGAAPPAAAAAGAAAPPAPPEGTLASFSCPSTMSWMVCERQQPVFNEQRQGQFTATHLVDVLALELRHKLGQSLLVGLDTNRVEETLDVRRRGAGVSTEGEKEVGSNVLHF